MTDATDNTDAQTADKLFDNTVKPEEATPVEATETPEEKPEEAKEEIKEPIKYDLKAPEGQELDQEMMDKFLPIFEEARLPNEVAQQLVNQFAESLPSIVEQASKQAWDGIESEIKQRSSEWEQQVKKDPELGGAKLAATTHNIANVYEAFLTKEETAGLKAVMNEQGIGNHPALVKLLSNVGALIAEDSFKRGNASEAPKDAATILFGESTN